jgi:dihydrofolate reductase
VGNAFLHINVSLDGYICDASGVIDWHFADDEFQQYLDDLLSSIHGMVFGRVAFDELADYWPHAGDEVSDVQRTRMHDLPKYVLSGTARATSWNNSHVLGPDPLAAFRDLVRDVPGDLAVFAGGGAAVSLLRAGLLDELRLVLNPVTLGGGTRLFDGAYPRAEWRLTDNRRFPSGALVLTYGSGGA